MLAKTSVIYLTMHCRRLSSPGVCVCTLYELHSCIKHGVYYTRWFKYAWDKLWLVYTQSVPVIFEPPCILCQKISPLEFLYLWRFGVMYCIGDRYVEWEPRLCYTTSCPCRGSQKKKKTSNCFWGLWSQWLQNKLLVSENECLLKWNQRSHVDVWPPDIHVCHWCTYWKCRSYEEF